MQKQVYAPPYSAWHSPLFWHGLPGAPMPRPKASPQPDGPLETGQSEFTQVHVATGKPTGAQDLPLVAPLEHNSLSFG
jgi:hypothetical protein